MENNKIISEHCNEKRESYDFKSRRFPQWAENYSLYRDRVVANRLTQRQAINFPIMRESIQTWISKIDEPPEIKFKSRGSTNRHRDGEIIMDELWKHYYDNLSLDILDNLDKKIVGLQGRSFKIIGMKKGEIFIDIIDPYDIEISPRVNPLDLNSAQYIIRKGIFKPLKEILSNHKYNESEKSKLKFYLASKEGLIKSKETYDSYIEKNNRLKDLGATNFDDYNVSEVIVELNESYKLVWNASENRYVRHLRIIAADTAVLYDGPIKKALGINGVPIVTWADDPDLNDIWCDGKGDSVRTINKVINMYFSQDLENRTYRNFGMYFFNTMNGQFQPRAFDPKPFAMFGLPGNPNEVMKQVEIPALNDTMQQIEYLKNMVQSSIAQTPAERGEQTKSRTTLGEVQLNLEQSQGRNSVSRKHYTRAWKQIAHLFYEFISNNNNGEITLYKKGADGKMYSKSIYPSDFVFPEGYDCEVVFKSDSDAMDQFSLQKTQYILTNFMTNPIATKIAKRKQLELMGWTTEEVDQAMQAEEMALQTGASESPAAPLNNEQIMQQQ